jgi:hypothetical protein
MICIYQAKFYIHCQKILNIFSLCSEKELKYIFEPLGTPICSKIKLTTAKSYHIQRRLWSMIPHQAFLSLSLIFEAYSEHMKTTVKAIYLQCCIIFIYN